jgi:hypothetical protein
MRRISGRGVKRPAQVAGEFLSRRKSQFRFGALLLRRLECEVRAHPHQLPIIHKKYPNGNSSNGCERQDLRTLPGEVAAPLVGSRVKEPGEFSGVWIDAGNVRTFVPIIMVKR